MNALPDRVSVREGENQSDESIVGRSVIPSQGWMGPVSLYSQSFALMSEFLE
jgi:hypothetical protein